jgi:hypothetical protein
MRLVTSRRVGDAGWRRFDFASWRVATAVACGCGFNFADRFPKIVELVSAGAVLHDRGRGQKRPHIARSVQQMATLEPLTILMGGTLNLCWRSHSTD